MRAIILAAGKGSRLKSFTKNQPKSLLKIQKRPILEYQLNALLKNNIKSICVVVGYKHAKIVKFLDKFKKKMNIKIIYNPVYDVTDSAYSFYLARNFVMNKSYLHLNCDIWFDDLVLKKILSSNQNVLCCRSDLKLGSKMDLIKFGKKNNKIIKFRNFFYKSADAKVFGVAKFDKNFSLSIIKRIEKDLFSGELKKKCFGYLKDLVKKKNIHFIKLKKNNIKEINTINDYKNF